METANMYTDNDPKAYIMDKLVRRPTAKPRLNIQIQIKDVMTGQRVMNDKRKSRPQKVGDIPLTQDMAKVVQKYIGQVVNLVKLDDGSPLQPYRLPTILTEPNFTQLKKVVVDEKGQLAIDGLTTSVEDMVVEPEKELIEEIIEETEPVLKKPKAKAGPKEETTTKQPKLKQIKLPADLVHGVRVDHRLPKPADLKKLVVRSSAYYMSNRKLYMQKLAELFKTYGQELLDESTQVSCDRQGSTTGERQLFIHQRIVREYLNLFTPYRGLLLYHGLGSGKTCTSIAIAEGAKTDKRIFVLTPASLKMNFFSELKKCGDALYKKNQFWEFVSVEGKPENIVSLAKALSISEKTVKKNKGAWLMNLNEPEPNFAELSADQQKQLDEQLNEMIRAKYVDINYNGLTSPRLKKFVEEYGKHSPSGNPFDHSVVLIDEAHNLVSRIVNSLSRRATASISAVLYELLMSAQDVRIVFMSGTPIINYPNEIAVLFNMLRGYIKTWKIPVGSGGHSLTREKIVSAFDKAGLNTYDYVDYSNDTLTITRNPYGFVNKEKMTKAKANANTKASVFEDRKIQVHNEQKKKKGGSDEEAIVSGGAKDATTDKKKTAKKLVLKLKPGANKNKKTKKLVGKKEEVVNAFEIKDGVLKINERPESEEADDANVDPDEVEQEYRDYQFNQGESNPHRGGASSELVPYGEGQLFYGGAPVVNDRYDGVFLDEQGNISDNDFIVAVRQALQRFADVEINAQEIKEQKYKCLPDKYDDFVSAFIDMDSLIFKREDVLKKRILGLTSYFRSAQESLLPRFIPTNNAKLPYYHIENIPMSDFQFVEYSRVRAEEIDQEKKQRTQTKAAMNKEMFKIASSYRVFSRAYCNFAFPNEISRPMPPKKRLADKDAAATYDAEELDNIVEGNEDDVPDDGQAKIVSEEYAKQQEQALKMLFDRKDQFLVKNSIGTYSPKFKRILENVESPDHEGLHLVYSAFRTLEGIGILRLVLLANGFEEFKLKRTGDGGWDIEAEELSAAPKFVLYTGTETPEEKEVIRNIYNTNWDFVPANLLAKLRARHENNFMGEIIKVIMITSSGAEGINLENTRYVHIVEPYWHMVRIDQVVGRARRICSHKNLDESLRTIQVFLYMSTFTDEQRRSDKNKGIMNHDRRRMIEDKDKNRKDQGAHSITTDESLFETAIMKNNLTGQILKSVKETSIDCTLYDGSKEGLVCYNYGYTTTNEFGAFPKYEEDFAVIEGADQREQKAQIVGKVVKGKKYAINMETKQVYDYDAYVAVPSQKVFVGRYDVKDDIVW